MGIWSAFIVNTLLKGELARRAWLSSDDELWPQSEAAIKCRLRPRRLFIQDTLIYFRQRDTATRYRLSAEGNTPSLFGAFWAEIRAASACENAVFIAICDDKRYVPHRKGSTQAKRAERGRRDDATKGLDEAEPYPPGWKLVDAGVALPGEEEPQLIDLRRLRASDPTLRSLWQAFVPLIDRAMAAQTDPFTFIFDFDADTGPVAWKSMDGRCHGPKHHLGEADPAMIWWLHYALTVMTTSDDSLLLHMLTTDTDLVPLYLLWHSRHYAEYRQRLAGVVWRRGRSEWVDLPTLAEQVAVTFLRSGGGAGNSSAERPARVDPLAMFAWFCAANDNDYVDRGMFAFGIGGDAMLVAVRDLALWLHTEAATPPNARALFERYVRHIYHHKRVCQMGGPTLVPAHHRKPPSAVPLLETCRNWYTPKTGAARCAGVPSDAVLARCADDIDFVFQYWLRAPLGLAREELERA